MDQIDINLSQAWARISAACKRDRVETLKRFRRVHGWTMRGTPRAWCAAIRAADTRINPHTAAIEFYEEPRINTNESNETRTKRMRFGSDPYSCSFDSFVVSNTIEAVARGVPHVVTLEGALIRKLIKPIEIAWPGVPRAKAAKILGVSNRSVANYLKAGTLKLWGYDTATMQSQRGRPVPIVYTPSKIDPGAMAGAGPDAIWGTLWHYRHEKIPLEYEARVRREPRWKFINGRMKLLGWDWICPGRICTAEIAESAEQGQYMGGTTIGRSVSSASSAVNSLLSCGRRVRYLYGPLPMWTLAKSLGANLELEFPDGCGLAGAWNPGIEDRWAGMRSFACKHCWNVRGMTLTCSSGWNDFVTWLSGGLLYGHEVKRPRVEAPRRRRKKFAHHRHPRTVRFRERLLPLLLEDESRDAIARRLGVKIGVVDSHTKVIYRAHRVHSRSQLAKKLRRPFAKRAALPIARIVERRKIVLKLRRAGMSLRKIARELKINLKTAHADVIALRLQGRLPDERSAFRISSRRPVAALAIRAG